MSREHTGLVQSTTFGYESTFLTAGELPFHVRVTHDSKELAELRAWGRATSSWDLHRHLERLCLRHV